jgi:hypothetical protein
MAKIDNNTDIDTFNSIVDNSVDLLECYNTNIPIEHILNKIHFGGTIVVVGRCFLELARNLVVGAISIEEYASVTNGVIPETLFSVKAKLQKNGFSIQTVRINNSQYIITARRES